MNGAGASTRESHKRILELIAAEDWKAFISEDEHLLESMMITQHIAFAIGGAWNDKIRLRLTPYGWAYLEHLKGTAASDPHHL